MFKGVWILPMWGLEMAYTVDEKLILKWVKRCVNKDISYFYNYFYRLIVIDNCLAHWVIQLIDIFHVLIDR